VEPNKFRESRQAINLLCDNINVLISQNEVEASKACFQDISSRLDELKPQAEGEIQKRSVKNLSVKVNALSTNISKLKPKKGSAGKKEAKTAIIWDEERVGHLSTVFLEKVFTNMKNDKNATVCFATTGKGIRPSYQIEFGSHDITAFSGSGHKPLKRTFSTGAKKTSRPFPHGLIDSILAGE